MDGGNATELPDYILDAPRTGGMTNFQEIDHFG